MNKRTASALMLVVATLAIAAPTLLALHLAKIQGFETESGHVLAYARDVLNRSETTSAQLHSGIDLLVAQHAADPCSDRNIALMRQIDFTSSNLLSIGAVSDNKLICSSHGRETVGLPLGVPGVVGPTGASIRSGVSLPFSADIRFFVVERGGYAAIAHQGIPLEATTDEEDVSLATFTTSNRQIRSSRGFINPAWLERLGTQTGITFIDDGYLVAIARSERYTTASLAAIPAFYIDERTREFAAWLVPIGLLGGILLALAVLYLAKVQLAMPAMLRTALRRGEFFLLYQPIVDLRSGNIAGAEALIRWQRAEGELVAPDVFIPIAEECGLIQQITERVMALVARDAADLFRRYPDFYLTINLSPADLQSNEIVGKLDKLALCTSAGPGNLVVEVTERGFLDTDTARAVVRELRGAGIRVAIDDFGTGYSSLAYLESFELDMLKIDKTFVNSVGTGAATSQVAPHIIAMAKDLRLDMTAEGVEQESQAAFLRERGVQFAQGWLFGKPMPLTKLVAMLSPSARAA